MSSNSNGIDNQLDSLVEQWLEWDQNPKTRSHIEKLKNSADCDELRKLLSNRLSFGTAGLRGRMGAGYSQMNDLVIIQTSQGLARYLVQHYGPEAALERGIVIGFDARYNSSRWATLAARACLTAGISVHLFSDIVPTPYIPFSIKHLKCIAGLIITASHNPKDDNGYKVYFDNGAQIVSPHDKGIQQSIEKNLKPWDDAWDVEGVRSHSSCKEPLEQVNEAYLKMLKDGVKYRDTIIQSQLRLVYTSLHGVGHRYMERGLKELEFQNSFPVKSQMDPDPEFPTVKFPNPEEGQGVLDESFKTAKETDSTLILANDPDVDRCAIAERLENGDWKTFNGNEMGALLGYWLLKQFRDSNKSMTDLKKVHMISSTVSSKILESMAKKEGFSFHETLTGFKWMGNLADRLEKEDNENKVLFAFEEAIGFMIGSRVVDKDGIQAALQFAQMKAYLQVKESKTLAQKLEELYHEYGFHSSYNSYYLCYEPDTIHSIFNRIANYQGPGTYPGEFDGVKVTRVRDLNRGYDTATPDNKPALPVSKSSYMVTFYFENGTVLTIRTSGTEPKIKFYSEAIADPTEKDWEQIRANLKSLVNTAVTECLQPEKNNIKPKQD